MTEHVNIIKQTAITESLDWPVILVGVIVIFIVLSTMLWMCKSNNANASDIAIRILSIVAPIGIAAIVCTTLIASVFFQVPTGRYAYEGTFDSSMSINEFEEFWEAHDNIEFRDGIWTWEDKE